MIEVDLLEQLERVKAALPGITVTINVTVTHQTYSHRIPCDLLYTFSVAIHPPTGCEVFSAETLTGVVEEVLAFAIEQKEVA